MSSEIFENREEDFKVLVEDARTKLRTQASRTSGGKVGDLDRQIEF